MRKVPSFVSTLLSFVLVGLLLTLPFVMSHPSDRVIAFTHTIHIGDATVTAAFAQTEAEHELGLSYTKKLPDGYGMLFFFDSPQVPAFWMKGMNYPLDMIWVSADNRVVAIDADIAPATYPDTFSPDVPVKYVLEVPAGFAARNTIRPGSMLQLN
jgi:uncharacterized membrane protein (UPF0127 family)